MLARDPRDHYAKMWPCCLCTTSSFVQLKGLVQHVNRVHSGQPNLDILCGIQGCVSRYKSCKSWSNHVRKRHKQIYHGDGEIENFDEDLTVETDIDPWENGQEDENSQSDIDIENFVAERNGASYPWEERKKRHARILLTFKEDNRLTQNTTQHFVQCVNYFAKDIVSECKNVFSNKLKEMKVDFSFADLDVHEQLEELESPLAGLETPWNQAAYFKEVFNCVVKLIGFVF